MKQILSFLIILSALFCPQSLTSQHNNIQRYVNRLQSDTLFTDAVVGIMVMDSKGRTVASWNPDMPLLTASTMKTISTGIALKVLGRDFRFSTKLGYKGYIQNGVLYGDLYIIGGADPTLGSRDTLAIPIEELFKEWREAITGAGIRRINGSVVADDRFFEHEIVPTGWAWSNLGPSYGSGTSGLSFSENLQYFSFIPGINEGDKVTMNNLFPKIPGMEYRVGITTSGKNRGNRTSYYVSDLSKVGYFKGTISQSLEPASVTVSNKFPHLSCAAEFRDYLSENGIYSDPEIVCARERDMDKYENIFIFHETFSPSITSIVNVTNRISNNFYAETLLKMIGKMVTGSGSYDSSRVAVVREMSALGVKTKGFSQNDGSGLSRQNYVSARFFCNYFRQMENSEIFDIFFNSLPQPGGAGTLKSVLSSVKPIDKERIHAKSGSLANVRCYAGYVRRKNGELMTFAILTNNFSARTAQMQVGIEGFMEELIKY
ncbi:MAG: D-alanyl-D-alanine carboxypeptidase/D-alanyl-D-alanine-endopeptidase [Bacteroidales bacterium]|nr:D-alanyl-D-alanine carboxypeptidase/D-alanyl-D-alanine-endopeptidase [Bacteroidales bacterium]